MKENQYFRNRTTEDYTRSILPRKFPGIFDDDPNYFPHEDSTLKESIEGDKVTFLGGTRPIKNILAGAGYHNLKVNVPADWGQWDVFENEKNRIGLYRGNLSDQVDITRFMVKAPKEDSHLETFVNDLDVIGTAHLERVQYHNYHLFGPIINGCWAGLFGGFVSAGLLSLIYTPLAIIGLPIFIGSPIIAGVNASKKRKKLFPNTKNDTTMLSRDAENYLYTGEAMNSLKQEAFATFLEYISPVNALEPADCDELTTIEDLEENQLVAINATPVAAFKQPFSRINQKGSIEGKISGGFDGHFPGLFGGRGYGDIELGLEGSFKGTGDIAGIRENTPIEWLMKDENGNKFVVWDNHLTDSLKSSLDKFSKEDFVKNGIMQETYSDIMKSQLDKFSHNNADIFYSRVLPMEQTPIDERKPIKVYGQVIDNEGLPKLQMIGFEDKNNGLVLTQQYPVTELTQGMQKALKKLGIISEQNKLVG